MNHRLENLVRCPQCKQGVCVPDETDSAYSCPKCAASYLVHDGVVDLVPDLHLERGLAVALMQSPTMARIYEGKLWRRSSWQQRAIGIKLEVEETIVMQAAQAQWASAVLDVACGSGLFTRHFGQVTPQGRVVGLDVSMPMLQWAANKDMQENTENVSYVRASAEELPFEDATFDRVNCCGALHLFPNLDQVFREVRRVLKPGGRFTAGTFRERIGLLGRLRTSTGHSLGVSCFTPEGMQGVLAKLSFVDIRIHYDVKRWMIISADKN